MQVVYKYSEIELYLIAQVLSPLIGQNGELKIKTPFLYAIVRVGKVQCNGQSTPFFGLRHESSFSPTFSEKVERLISSEEDFKSVSESCPILPKILHTQPRFEEVEGEKTDFGMRRFAVLIDSGCIKPLTFPIEDGMGVPIEREHIAKLADDCEKRNKANIHSFHSAMPILGMTHKQSVSSEERLMLNIGFYPGLKQIRFLAKAMERFGDSLREEREKVWNGSRKIQYST